MKDVQRAWLMAGYLAEYLDVKMVYLKAALMG